MSRYLDLIRNLKSGGSTGAEHVPECEKSEISEIRVSRVTDRTDSYSIPECEKSEISEIRSDACTACGKPLALPETQAVGVCLGCQDEAQWVETLARMALRRERTKRAVAARTAQLRMGGDV